MDKPVIYLGAMAGVDDRWAFGQVIEEGGYRRSEVELGCYHLWRPQGFRIRCLETD